MTTQRRDSVSGKELCPVGHNGSGLSFCDSPEAVRPYGFALEGPECLRW